MKKAASLLFAVALTTAACGDDGAGGSDAGVDGAVDAGGIDAAPNCPFLDGFYPDLGAKTGTAIVQPTDELDPMGPTFLTLEIPLNQDANPDVLFIEIWADAAPHDMGFLTGLFSLIGDNGDLFECGNCVYIAADREVGQPLKFHMAASGTIQIDAIDDTPDTGTLQGSLNNVVLREVTVGAGGQTPVDGGCRTRIEAMSFDFGVATP